MKRRHCVTIAPAALVIAAASLLTACGTQATNTADATAATPVVSATGGQSVQQVQSAQIVAQPATANMPAAHHAHKTHHKAAASTKTSTAASSSATASTSGSGTSGTSGSTAAAGADPSGQPVPVGNQPGFKQVFYSNFSGDSASVGQFSNCTNSGSAFTCGGLPSAVSSQWWDYPDGWNDTSGTCQYEPSQTLSISGQVLNMFIHTSSSGQCMAAAPVAKLPNPVDSDNGQLYGMYSVRMRSDPVSGYLAAFLLWPDSEKWPQDGEVDFPNGELNGTVGAFMHHQGGTSGSDQDAYISNTTFTSWHTYTMQWTPSYMKFMIDGKVIGESTNASEIPDTPMHWVMQTESDLSGAKPSASAQGNLQIAWAAVWSYDPSSN